MIYSEKNFEIGELSDGGCDIKFLHFHFLHKKVSRWLPERYRNYVPTYLLLRPDVTFAASGRIFYSIRMYLLLHQNVIFFPFSLVKLQKTIEKA